MVFADSEIRAVPLHHCDSPAAATCRSCVALQDPHCAWDATANLCVAVLTKLHDNDADKTLFQDIPTGRHRSCGRESGIVFDVDYCMLLRRSWIVTGNECIMRGRTVIAYLIILSDSDLILSSVLFFISFNFLSLRRMQKNYISWSE